MPLIQTHRLTLRRMSLDDRAGIAAILQDPQVMTAYEHAFSDAEVEEWIARQLARYEQYGFGLWAVIRKEDGRLIGQAGLTMQETPEGQVLEIGYLFAKAHWHQGYATEAAEGCKQYAFGPLNSDAVFCIIRDNNFASQRVATRIGMRPVGQFVKHYYGMDMPHIVYRITREECGLPSIGTPDGSIA